MAILSNGKFYGFLCSVKETGQKLANGAKEYVEDFVSGFVGHGWKIWEYVKGKWMLEIDAIRVRGQFTVFELLVSKIRAIIGAQAITQGHAKIKSVTIADSEVYKEIKTEIYAEDFTNSKWVKLAADNLIISSGAITVNGSSAFSPTLFVESVTNAINSFKFSIAGLKKSIQLTWTDKEGVMQMMEITEDGEYEFPQSYQLVDSPLETQRVGIIINNTEDAVVIKQQAISFEYSSFKTTEQCYCLEIEDDINTISEYDFIRCQSPVKKYHVQVGSVSDKFINVPVSEFEVDEEGNAINPPEVGDEVVQFGNGSHIETYIGRHSAIYLHADESGQPAIDVLDGIYSKELNDCLKVRMGGDIPGTEGLKGLYTVNGMIKGVDDSGHITYCLYPDGTAELGDSSALFRPDKSGYIAGGAIAWKWDDDKGVYVCSMKDVQVEWDGVKNSPEWIKDWTKEGTFIGGKFVAAPHGFFGTKDDKEQLTGILMGDKVMVNGVERSGIFALVDNDVVFELDPITRKYKFKGEVIADSGIFNGTVNATKGSIGGFEIESGRIGSEIKENGSNEYNGGRLAIYKDLIRVGNDHSYSLLGGDTIPASASGSYTSTCRLTNKIQNDSYAGSNYGMMINVSGATKNYGIKSDAPIVATSCISMKTASYITFVNGKSDNGMDLSRYNVFLLASSPTGINLNLPDESEVAAMFGLSSLPDDFSLMFTLHVRNWSYDIGIYNVYDWNANLINVKLVKGDSLTLLISKYDGFRYDAINRQD